MTLHLTFTTLQNTVVDHEHLLMAMVLSNGSGPPSRTLLPATPQNLLRNVLNKTQKRAQGNQASKFPRFQSDRESVGHARTGLTHGGPTPNI